MTFNPRIHGRRSIRLQGYDYSQPGAYFVTICNQSRQHLFGEIIDGAMHHNPAGAMVERWYRELENKFTDIVCDAFVCMPNHVHFVVVNVGAQVGPDSSSEARYRRVESISATVRDDRKDDVKRQESRVEYWNEIPVENRSEPHWRIPGEQVGEFLGGEGGEFPGVEGGEFPGEEGEEFLGGEGGEFPGVEGGEFPGVEGGEFPGEEGGEFPGEEGGEFPGVEGGEFLGGEGEHVGSPLWRVVQWFKTMTTNEYIRGVKQCGWPRFPGKLWQRNYYERIVRDEYALSRIREYIRNNPALWGKDKMR
ncbi:MAG TPA: hypothetical protein PK916_15810 [Bacteroidota bacterium]|nr:hypothetical protein [Bacteroidota bacterium]